MEKTLMLMRNGTADFEIIVVDNASADSSSASIRKRFPQVRLIERPVNNGVAGWNDGFAVARGTYFVVLDDDSHIESGLAGAIDYLDHHPPTGILALNVSGGAFPTADLPHLADTIDIVGCGAIIRKELYQKIGGFAEWLFIYTHEWEYAIRCLEAGYSIKYFRHCAVIHRTSAINRSTKRLKIFSVRNEMAIVYKFFGARERNRYLVRVYLNNLKGIPRSGVRSVPWYVQALVEFLRLRKELVHTPVRQEVQDIYSRSCWSTRQFLNII